MKTSTCPLLALSQLTTLLVATTVCLLQGETRQRISVSADGSLVAAKSEGHFVHLYTADTLAHVGKLKTVARDIALSANGAVLAVSGPEGLAFHDTLTDELRASYETTGSVAFSQDGRWCLAREKFPNKDGLLIDMTNGRAIHRIPKARGLGFSGDGDHFVIIREERESSTSKEVAVMLTRHTIDGARASEPVEIRAKTPDARGASILPVRNGYVVESGSRLWTVRDDGATTAHDRFGPPIYSGAPGHLLVAAEPDWADLKRGVHIGWGRSVEELERAMTAPERLFLQLQDNPDLPELLEPEIADLTIANQHYYLTTRMGSVIKIKPDGEVIAFRDSRSPIEASALPPRPAPTQPGTGPPETNLAAIEVTTPQAGKVRALQPGASRLSGGFSGKIEEVGEELRSASFTVAPWKSTPAYAITVKRAGYLYFLKGSKAEREKLGLQWEFRPEAVSGAYLSGAYRTQTTAGQQIQITGYELSVVAAEIELK